MIRLSISADTWSLALCLEYVDVDMMQLPPKKGIPEHKSTFSVDAALLNRCEIIILFSYLLCPSPKVTAERKTKPEAIY